MAGLLLAAAAVAREDREREKDRQLELEVARLTNKATSGLLSSFLSCLALVWCYYYFLHVVL